MINENEDEEYDDLAGIFDDDEDADTEYYEVQVTDIEVISLHAIAAFKSKNRTDREEIGHC